MNFIHFLFITMFSFLSAFRAQATTITDENKENRSPHSNISAATSILQDLDKVNALIEKAHKNADPGIIMLAYKNFQALNYTPEEWKSAKLTLSAQSWPSQKSDRETVAGYLFYPRNTNELMETPYTSKLLRRIDMLWAFTCAAKFNHALAKHHLVYTLDQLRTAYTSAPRPEFFIKLYQETLKDLEGSPQNPDACYILGLYYTDFSQIGMRNCIPKKALELHEQGGDFKNRLQVLLIKDRYAGYARPTVEEFLTIAREGYGPAYLEAAKQESDEAKKITYLEEASLKYAPALLELGAFYVSKQNITKAREAFEKAAIQGFSAGYLEQGFLAVGHVDYTREQLTRIIKQNSMEVEKVEEIKAAINAFAQVGKMKNPLGFECLANVYEILYQQEKNKEKKIEYKKTFYYYLLEGIKLGWDKSYDKMYRNFSEENFNSIVKKYGYAPQECLRFVVEKFLNEA